MLRVLWNNKSAMMAQQEKLDSISNNLSNVNTDGYKSVDVSFKDLVYETLQRKGYPVSEDALKEPFTGSGVKAGNWYRNNSQGNLNNTGISTDLCIDGKGYFQVTLPNGQLAYTRSGSFSVDVNGTLVDKNGNRINIYDANGKNINSLDNPDRVHFTKDNFIVNSDGAILLKDKGVIQQQNQGEDVQQEYEDDMQQQGYEGYEGYDGYEDDIQGYDGYEDDIQQGDEEEGMQQGYDGGMQKELGKIKLYNTVGDDSLRSIGNSMYAPNPGVEMYVVNDPSILQGFTEMSNVDVGKEMTDMIIAQRAFELNSRGLKTADEMWGMINSMRGR